MCSGTSEDDAEAWLACRSPICVRAHRLDVCSAAAAAMLDVNGCVGNRGAGFEEVVNAARSDVVGVDSVRAAEGKDRRQVVRGQRIVAMFGVKGSAISWC